MRIKVFLHYLGLLIAIIGFAMLLPLGWSLYNKEPSSTAFAISMASSLSLGLLLWRLTPIGRGKLSRREAIMLVAGGWLLASAFGALPYQLSGALPNYLNAYFEAVSSFTTTGATVFTSISSQDQGILLWRSLGQWLGGMGIIMLFVALFPMLGVGAAHLVEAEMPAGQQGERLTARMRDTAKALWLIYLGLTVSEFVMLRIANMDVFHALTVTFSTIPIGGFTPTDLSIGAYNSIFIEGIIMFFMIASGVNFGLYYFLIWRRQPGYLLKNPEFRLYIFLLIGATLLINLDLIKNMGMSLGDALRFGSFNTVSIMTTTGFATTDFNLWPVFARSALLILMVIGASAGSTGGALKVIRLLVLIKYTYCRILLTFNPRAVIPLKIGGNVIAEGIISRIIGLAILYFAILTVGFLIMSALGLDHLTALSSVTASLGNVGPGLGSVGPAENYFFIPPLGKGVLIFCMLAGRLELFTLLVLFTPAFWRWR
jgi:trk system potassium uptake protein TrkH|tara:strand:+ start:506 stop:1960 length:1455 start_codon:yes stop_codon:yes gene_type:complete